jgi:N-acetylglucosamine kinase-like BadF-type ATPase
VSVVLGVDVGGSGLRALRVGPGGPQAPPLQGDGAAITAVGIDVERLLSVVMTYDDVHAQRPDVVVWSMRGLVGLSDPDSVLSQVRSRLGACTTVVASDAVTGLVGALGRVGPGAVVAAGSGVVAFATDLQQVWRRIDGWGHVLADRGSGAWIGLQGLRAALATEDGVPGGSVPLHELAVHRWGPPREWPRMVMTGGDAPARLAAFAPEVASLAGTDAVAAAICLDAGTRLAESLASAAASVPGHPASAVGGLLRIDAVATAFAREAGRRGLVVQPARGTALDGALALGRHVAQGHPLGGRSPYLLLA